jgi:hypothetical protein
MTSTASDGAAVAASASLTEDSSEAAPRSQPCAHLPATDRQPPQLNDKGW